MESSSVVSLGELFQELWHWNWELVLQISLWSLRLALAQLNILVQPVSVCVCGVCNLDYTKLCVSTELTPVFG
jgi:hypothetical protein